MSQEIGDFFDADSLLNHMGGNRVAKNMSASNLPATAVNSNGGIYSK